MAWLDFYVPRTKLELTQIVLEDKVERTQLGEATYNEARVEVETL